MLKYRHLFLGDFYKTKIVNGKLYDDHDFYNFQIEVPIPINYSTEEEAVRCPCSLRFEIENGHVVLRIYSGWKQGLDENGKWFERVEGNVVDTIKWEEYWKYKMSRSKVVSKNMGLFRDDADYLPDATPWDELFDVKSLPRGWRNTVEGLAYGIHIVKGE